MTQHNAYNRSKEKNKCDDSTLQEYVAKIKKLEQTSKELTAQLEKSEIDNKRLKTQIIASEERVKGALEDQMTLHHSIQTLEEEVLSSKINVTKLVRDLEYSKSTNRNVESMQQKIVYLKSEISNKDNEISTTADEIAKVTKLQSDVAEREALIKELETQLGNNTVQIERGSVAVYELEKLRDQLRVKVKEAQDMSLQNHELTNQLREFTYLNKKFTAVMQELTEHKLKSEKIPALVSEIARLRGSSRATSKTLEQQDLVLEGSQQTVKKMEKELQQLQHECMMLRGYESKYKEARREIEQLKLVATEVDGLKSDVKVSYTTVQ